MADWASIRDGRILFEDEAALVLNKPAGISVMGERHETDIVRLARDAGEPLFPAHRIDKVTSGAVLFARAQRFHGDLTRQFNRRTVTKAYLAVTATTGLPEQGTIDLPLSVGRKNRVRIAAERADILSDENHWYTDKAFTHVRTYPSVTAFARAWSGEGYTVLVVRPLTGRRHQIRVHLAWLGHEIVGDPLFGKSGAGRTLLHSWRLGFDAAWLDGQRITVTAAPDADFWTPLGIQPLPDDVLDAAVRRLATLVDTPDTEDGSLSED